MTPTLLYCCCTPGCKSNITLHPDDAKTDPARALADRGWEVVGKEASTKTITSCLCPMCAQKKSQESVK